MSVSITGKLTKDANEFQAGESVGFGLRLGERYYDRDTQQKEWTNYEFVVFAKADSQIEFYRNALREGSIIEVFGAQQKIKTFTTQQGETHISIEILEAKLGFIWSGESTDMGQPAQSPQQRPMPAPASPAPQASPIYEMTPKADGYTREQYLQTGWTDEQLIAQGYMQELPF